MRMGGFLFFVLWLCPPMAMAADGGACHCYAHKDGQTWMKGCQETIYPHGGLVATTCVNMSCERVGFTPTDQWVRLSEGSADCTPCKPKCDIADDTLPRKMEP